MSGEEFIGVHGGGWQKDTPQDQELNEDFSIRVTLTRRTGQFPMDKVGPELLYQYLDLGFEKRLREIIAAIHLNYDVMNAANAILYAISPLTNGFLQPLWFNSAIEPEWKRHDWFWAQPEKNEAGQLVAWCGIAQTLVFGQAKRIQSLGDLT